MMQRPIAESESRQAGRATPKCVLKWTIDPATGKPVARWTAERSETVAKFGFPRAA
jgi:hypothetical protein